jgi:archaemetzincin
MSQHYITLVSFGFFEEDLLWSVADAVSKEFLYSVRLREGHLDLAEHFNAGRRQYNGNELLKEIDSFITPDALKTIGLFSVDLYIPILTYIYGQAVLGGRTGIASVYRLYNERYGLAANRGILIERFKKEVIHELGHTFGLIHCHDPLCVMKSSTYVEEIDLKEQHLCHSCRSVLKKFLV